MSSILKWMLGIYILAVLILSTVGRTPQLNEFNYRKEDQDPNEPLIPGQKPFRIKLAALTDQIFQSRKWSGCALITHQDKIQVRKCFGFADEDQKAQLRPETLFNTGSVS